MRMVITGAGGMLGNDLLTAATEAGLDALGYERSRLDITEAAEVDSVIGRAKPDVVVNCAAWTDVDGAETGVDEAFAANATGAANVAQSAARCGAWTVQISTDYVFDGSKREPYLESDPVGPISVYGRSKLDGEFAVAREAPGRHTIVRTSWLFGVSGRCFPKTILRLAGERDELTVVDDQIGCPTFTAHLAQALVELAVGTRPTGIVHLAAAEQCSWFEFASEIVRAADASCDVHPGTTADFPRPAPRPAYSVLRSERAGLPKLPDWREGLAGFMSSPAVAR
jgi:dTDP-4-dehydrorhamnose reductase